MGTDGKSRKHWRDMSSGQQTLVLVGASIELALTATAAVDLWRRPRADVRGPKLLWAVCLVIQPFGPIAYLTAGARRSGGADLVEQAG